MKKTSIRHALAASTGLSHLSTGDPCQDSAAFRKAGQTGGVCLSDGAGSARASHVGAKLVTSNTLDYVIGNFADLWGQPDKCGERILTMLEDRLKEAASSRQVAVKDLACTVLFAVVSICRSHVKYICGNLGDGLIISRVCGKLDLCLGAENGEFANQTWFVTSSDAVQHFRVISGQYRVTDTPGWMLTTDGAAPFLYGKSSGRFAPAIQSLLEDTRTMTDRRVRNRVDRFVQDVVVPRTGDDCSLGILQVDAAGRQISRRPSV